MRNNYVCARDFDAANFSSITLPPRNHYLSHSYLFIQLLILTLIKLLLVIDTSHTNSLPGPVHQSPLLIALLPYVNLLPAPLSYL